VTCARCKQENPAGQGYCVSCGVAVGQPDISELPSGTSTMVGPRFFVPRARAAPFVAGVYRTRRHRSRLRLSLAVPVLLVIAELVWVRWHTYTPLPDSRPIIVIAKLIKSFRAEQKQEFPARSVAKSGPDLRIMPASRTTVKSPAVMRVTSTSQNPPPAATLRSTKTSPGDASAHQDQVSQLPTVSDRTAESLERAMTKGDPDAPIRLANMYFTGEGVPQSCEEALSLLLTAASKPNVRARNRLASMYAVGICVQRDRVQAYRWLLSSLAVDPNDTWARQNRALTWRQMTPEERNIADADQ
jgi:Sel1 repeat-containing protein